MTADGFGTDAPAAALLTAFATCPKGAEHLLAGELRALGARRVRPARAGVAFEGDLAALYRACMWTRVASRVLLQLARVPAPGPDELYAAVAALPWEEHVPVDGTLAVDFVNTSPGITDTRFGAQLVKDAVVDRLRERYGRRPNVDARDPDVRINVSSRSGQATIAIDLSGPSLHRRGWREEGVQHAAPLKENLAAAVLLAAGWDGLAREGAAFCDPMCGSGTLVVEAAAIAADRAPGLLRSRWGFDGWLGHDAATWDDILADADERAEAGLADLAPMRGSDSDPRSIELARDNARRAGLGDVVVFDIVDLAEATAPAERGLVAVNPPYGERIGAADRSLGSLYRRLGRTLAEGFAGWRAAVLTTERSLADELRLPSPRRETLYNGAIECELVMAEVPADADRNDRQRRDAAVPASREPAVFDVTSGAAAFANRLRKNAKRLGKWARRESIECYRVYDADLPDYAVAVDRYGPALVVSEYAAPAEIDERAAARRLEEALAASAEVLEVAPDDVHVKVRRRQRGSDQYEPVAREGDLVKVTEGGLTFLVNLTDYLDTGLFLDHRPTRALLRDGASGRRFANLFCYTGAATVYAAAGGATATTSVDLSGRYLEWARLNMEVNGLDGPQHERVRADIAEWVTGVPDATYDLVFCDPPTFSNSARMDGTFDVRRDHVPMLRAIRRIVAPGGSVLFSTNSRGFKLGTDALRDGYAIRDITDETTSEDFARRPLHKAWMLERR